jgi:uncharacterized caspase-like protein
MRVIVLTAILVMVGSLAHAQARLALVVGIDDYQHVGDLQKARNDAVAVSAALEDVGFRVTTLIDPDRRTVNRALGVFAASIQPGDEVVFYFAGHGVEVDGRNYLLPADVPQVAPGQREFLIGESIAADRLLRLFQSEGARMTLMILDACRDNPFPEDGTRSLGGPRGLARMDPAEGAFILFSAGTGQTALDRLSNSDPNPNSVFTRALLPRIRQQGLALHELVRDVRSDVRDLAATVNHNQFPAFYDQLLGEFRFVPGVARPRAEETATLQPRVQDTIQTPAPSTPAPNPCAAARADWGVLRDTESVAALEQFSIRYAECTIFVAAARDRLRQIASAAEIEPQEPTAGCAPGLDRQTNEVVMICPDDGANDSYSFMPDHLRPNVADIAGSAWSGIAPVSPFVVHMVFDQEPQDRLGQIAYVDRSTNAVVCSGTLYLTAFRPMFTSGEYVMQQVIDTPSTFPCISNVEVSGAPASTLWNVTIADRTTERRLAATLRIR